MHAGTGHAAANDDGMAGSTLRMRAPVIAVPAGQMLLDSGFPKNDNTSL